MRTNRPNTPAEPQHRKPGPARLSGASLPGRRIRDAEAVDAEPEPGEDVTA